MSNKAQHSNKETKKQPALSLKEKRLAKRHKRESKDVLQTPFLPPHT